MKGKRADNVDTYEQSWARQERREYARFKAQWYASPEYKRFKRNQRRRRWPLASPDVVRFFCWWIGFLQGGKPKHAARRCTKRLGSRLCWNWRVGGTDRCHRHQRENSPLE